MASIAVIIVNYGTAELTLAAAQSVLEQAHGAHDVALHIVDNNSPQGDAEVIATEIAARGWQDQLHFHPEPENHGFGRGNNVVLNALAAADTRPDYAMLLNPDARLENEAVAILADYLDAHPGAGAAGAEIRNPGQNQPASAAYRFPNWASTFADAVNFGPISGLFAHRKVAIVPPPEDTTQVDWVSGAAVMFRFTAIEEVGFFDPEFFLYFEEVDLMLQLARAGWPSWYVPQAKVMHIEGAATGVGSGAAMRKPRPAYWYASWRHYFSKNHGRASALLTAAAYMAGGSLGVIIAAILRREPYIPAHFFRDFRIGVIKPLLRNRPPQA